MMRMILTSGLAVGIVLGLYGSAGAEDWDAMMGTGARPQSGASAPQRQLTYEDCLGMTDKAMQDTCTDLVYREQHLYAQQKAQQAAQPERQADQDAEVEAARLQALDMAAFDSGNALARGMDQEMQKRQLPPYHQPGTQK